MSITESLILICYSFVESHLNLHEWEESVLFNYLFWLYIYIVISNNTIKYVLISCKSSIKTLCLISLKQLSKQEKMSKLHGWYFVWIDFLIEGKEISWYTGVASFFFVIGWLINERILLWHHVIESYLKPRWRTWV